MKVGKFVYNGIPPAPASKGKVVVIYRVDMDGLLMVTATAIGLSAQHHKIQAKPTVAIYDLKT